MNPITIRIAREDEEDLHPGTFLVEQDGKMAIALNWDEMLGHVVALTMRAPFAAARIAAYPPGLYRMDTPEQIAAERERIRKLRDARDHGDAE